MFWRQIPHCVVDMGSRYVKAVSARYLGKNRFQVHRHFILDSPDEELFKGDPVADIEIPASYHRTVAELVRVAGLSSKYVMLLYPDFAFQAKVLPISSKLGDQEKDQAVDQETKTWLTGDADRKEFIFERREPGKLHNDILVFMAMLKRRSVVDIGALFQKHKAYPITVDMGLLNVINVFHDYLVDQNNKDKNIGVMNFGHCASSIAIFKDGNLACVHARGLSTEGHQELLVGGKAFTRRIMEHFKLPDHNAEDYKKEEVFFLPEFVPEQDKITNYQVIKPVFGELVKGLFAITENYMAFFREFKVDEIIMTGGGANFSNIDVVLGGHLNIYIKKGSQVVSIVDAAGNELPDDVKNIIIPAVGGCARES